MDAAQQVRAIIAGLKSRPFDNPRFEHIKGRYRFAVEGVGDFRVEVDTGRVTVLDEPGDADCTIQSSAEEFVRIASGQQNLITAFMQGRIRIEGDPALAQKLHGILPSPPAQSPDASAAPRGAQ